MTLTLRLLRAAPLAMARATCQPTALQRRAFIIPTAALRADLVQDMYLKELKAYKPTPLKSSDSEGQVQKFSAPKPPQSPDEGDIAKDLKAYEEQQVEVEGQVASGESAPVEEDWFEPPEEEEEAAAAH